MPSTPACRSVRPAFFAVLIGLAACGGGETTTPSLPDVTSLTITPLSDSLVLGATRQLAVRAVTANGSETSVSVTWSSSDMTIATVSPSGLVTAIAPGTVQVHAQASGVSGSATLIVRDGGVIGAAGGTVSAAQGAVALAIPAGALPSAVPVSVAPAAPTPPDAQAVAGAAYTFGPEGTQFAQPVTLDLTYDPAKVPTGLPTSALRVGYYADGHWEPVLEAAAIDVASRKLSVQIHHFSTYGIMAGNYCPQSGEPYITLQPGQSWSDVHSTANTCQQKVAFSPFPEAIGQTINTHDFLITLNAGKTYSITLGGGIAGKAATLTVFRGSTVAAQSVYDGTAASTRTVQITPATTGAYDIEVSSGGFTNGTWTRPSFSYTVEVSAGQ